MSSFSAAWAVRLGFFFKATRRSGCATWTTYILLQIIAHMTLSPKDYFIIVDIIWANAYLSKVAFQLPAF